MYCYENISGSKLFWEWSFIGSCVIIFVVIGNGLNINIVYGLFMGSGYCFEWLMFCC